MKKFTFLFLALLSFNFGYTQKQILHQKESEVFLTQSEETDSLLRHKFYINAMIKTDNNELFRSVPSDLELFGIYAVTINPGQTAYEALKSGNIDQSYYEKYIADCQIDTTYIDPNFSGLNKLNYYVGLSNNYETKHIIFDLNNNMDFSDDYKYIFHKNPDTGKFEDADINLKLNTTFYDGEKRSETELQFKMNPNPTTWLSSLSANDSALVIALSRYKAMVGGFDVNDLKFRVYAYNMYNCVPDIIEKDAILTIYNSESLKPTNARLGDTVILANREVTINLARNNSLYIRDLSWNVDSSAIGCSIPRLYSKCIDGNDLIDINEYMSDKLVLLDFWGSWCGPCLASIPKLREVYDKVKHRDDVVIIGIALEQEKDLPKLNNILKEQNIEWLNVWNDWDTKKSLSSPQGKLAIETFPTYIILDKSGKIIFNTNDASCKRDEAADKFLKLVRELEREQAVF